MQAALHADRYFNDAHVIVAVEHGDIVLHGFVLDEWDLLDAIRISRTAACHRTVINDLSLEVGGRR